MWLKLCQVFLFSLVCTACAQFPAALTSSAYDLSGEKALSHVRAQVALGPRPPGSPELEMCRQYIVKQLESFGYHVEDDAFEAVTPYGPKTMHNLIARRNLAEKKKEAIALASHYDTKYLENIRFLGANDAASSTGLLLELARVLSDERNPLDYWFVFLDGEEAFVEWSTFDSTYGSRHLAQRWKANGVTKRVRTLILLDMVGDKDLDLLKDGNSALWLRDMVWETARDIGLGRILSVMDSAVEDDHIPFIDVGIPAVDIIDLNFGPGNSYHHTEADTIDKISTESLEKVGTLVLAVLSRLQARFSN